MATVLVSWTPSARKNSAASALFSPSATCTTCARKALLADLLCRPQVYRQRMGAKQAGDAEEGVVGLAGTDRMRGSAQEGGTEVVTDTGFRNILPGSHDPTTGRETCHVWLHVQQS